MRDSVQILTPDQVDRVIARLAYEVLERNRGSKNLCILGIVNAGAELAGVLAEAISEVEGNQVPNFDLDVSAYRDDRSSSSTPRESPEGIPDLTGKHVILVDDVLFTGRTVRAALDAVVSFGRPKTIQLAVLIDRGHREYPVQADYVGKTIPTKHRERVVVTIGDRITVDIEE